MNLQSAAIPGSGTPKSGKKYLQNPPIRWPIHPHPKITTGIYGIERKFEWEWRDWTWIEEPFWWPASFSTCKGNVQLKFRVWVLAHHTYCSMLFFPLDVVLYPHIYIFSTLIRVYGTVHLRSNSHLFFKQIKGQILGDSPA